MEGYNRHANRRYFVLNREVLVVAGRPRKCLASKTALIVLKTLKNDSLANKEVEKRVAMEGNGPVRC